MRSLGRRLPSRSVAGACLAVLLLAAAPAARAEDEKPAEDEFSTTWIGLRGEVWYQPTLSLTGRVGGKSAAAALTKVLPADAHFDAQKDLGVQTHTPMPTYLDFSPGPVGLEMFVDTRWISLSLWAVTPFEYSGHTTLQRTITFAGQQFTASASVSTTMSQVLGGVDIKINVLNNRFVRVSPILGIRTLGINWTLKAVAGGQVGVSASTEDIAFPLTLQKFKVIPYPEVGGEVRVGYRDYVEGDLKLTFMYVEYGTTASIATALVDVGVTGYLPFLPNVGMRLGYRYFYVNASAEKSDPEKIIETEMRLYGFTASVIVRF